MKVEKISEFTTQRLSIYLRCLEALEEMGVVSVSSKALAERFNLNSAQIRKDLAYFGQFGVRGVGYIVGDLKEQLAGILGLNTGRRVCVVGGGNLGLALTEYPGFVKNGFSVVAVFDCAPPKIGQYSRTGVPIHDVRHLQEVVREKGITMAIIAVPAEAAQSICDQVMDAGIRAIFNFAPVRLNGRPGIKIKSIDLSISLESLSYFLTNQASERQLEEQGPHTDLAASATIE